MTIELGPELESLVAAMAQERGQTPEEFSLAVLTERVQAQTETGPHLSQEEFLRRLDALGSPIGAALTNEQLSRETMYD